MCRSVHAALAPSERLPGEFMPDELMNFPV
jgi:hypothetical protein